MSEELKQAERALDRMSGYLPRVYKDDIEIVRRALTAAQPAQAGEIDSEWQACVKLPVTVHVRKQRQGEAHVSTREGITPIKPDDLIMRGVSGEEYPIGRDIFEQTYRLAPTQPAAQATPYQRADIGFYGAEYQEQATPEPLTRSRECAEPMCACMGGPCAECPEGEREKEIADLRASRDFYKRRADSLQQAQSQMRDPERTMVCDILANGALLVPAGGRYAATPEPVGEARCSTCGVTMNEPHHPACGAVTAAIIGLNTMAAQDKEARRRELAEKIRETLRGVFTHPAPGVPDVEDLRDRLVAISAAVADSDDRAAQAMLGEILRALASAQAKGGE